MPVLVSLGSVHWNRCPDPCPIPEYRLHVDMHLPCEFTVDMQELEATEYGIGEEEVATSAPMVRALLVQRLEQIWSVCAPHVTGEVKADPRFIEAGIRVLDRLAKLYRLDSPLTPSGSNDIDPSGTALAAAVDQVAELEDRMRTDGV